MGELGPNATRESLDGRSLLDYGRAPFRSNDQVLLYRELVILRSQM